MRERLKLSGEPLKAERLDHARPLKHKPKIYPDDRLCEECGYPICRMNPGPFCYLHTPSTVPPVRGRPPN